MFLIFNDEEPENTNHIRIINIVVSSLSLTSSLLIIFLFWFFKEIRNLLLELIVCLCVTNIIYDITAYFPYDMERELNKFWCGFQSFLILATQNSSNLWTCIIGYCAFITIFRKDHLNRHRARYRTLFISIGVIIPLFLASM
jgi:hypothetical protein